MSLSDDDLKQIDDRVSRAVTAGIAFYDRTRPQSAPPATTAVQTRSYAEVGSPEFAEDRTQINSLNNKEIFAREATRFDKMFFASFDHSNDLNARLVKSFDSLLGLQDKLNDRFFAKTTQDSRWQDDNAYVTRYDLSNPNTLGTSDDVRGGVVPQNRGIDNATASLANIPSMVQSAVAQAFTDNVVFTDAIKGAVADAMNGTIPTLEAAVGAAVAAALANTPVTPKGGTTA